MTTATMGKQGAIAAKARVAWVSQHGNSGLSSLLNRAGHEMVECVGWGSYQTLAAEVPMDLVLCDAEMAAIVPAVLSEVPSLQIGESRPVSGGIATLAISALESALEPLLLLAVNLSQRAAHCRELERMVRGIRSGSALVGNSPIVRRLQGTLSRAADCEATVLIEGPPGSGKSLAARIIHCKSRRVGNALMAIDSATTTAEAFVKALEQARNTTLVVEDVDRLPAAAQAQLVRHLKERTAQGANQPRLIVTTTAHMPELVAKGAFREDLYYRLHAFPIVVPGLRERVEDIGLIAQALLEATSPATGKAMQTITPSALMLLESMPWPGNVAQLESVTRRAQLAAGGGAIDRDHVMPTASSNSPTVATASTHVSTESGELTEDGIRPFEEEEQLLLSRALRATKGNVRRAAQLLGIGRATLYRKIQQYRLRLQ